MALDVTFAGSVVVDTVKTVDTWPEKGGIAEVIGSCRSVGGCVANTGIDLKRLDPSIQVRALAAVGDDEAGAFATRALQEGGLDVAGVSRLTRTPTSATDVMTVAETGERTFFCRRGAGATFRPDVAEIPAGSRFFHLGYLLLMDALDAPDGEFGTAAARLLHAARARGLRTSVDLVSETSARVPDVVRPALRECDYAVINEVEAQAVTGIAAREANGRITPERLETLARAVMACGVARAAVVHAPEGSAAVDGGGACRFLPSLRLPAGWIRGSVGAGDAFCAGMIYAFLNGLDLVEGMRLARASAAANLASDSGTGGARALAEIQEIDRRYGT